MCAAAAFQQANAPAAVGLQFSMFGLTAPGDGSAKLQSTLPVTPTTVKLGRAKPAAFTGRMTVIWVGGWSRLTAAPAVPVATTNPSADDAIAMSASRRRMVTPRYLGRFRHRSIRPGPPIPERNAYSLVVWWVAVPTKYARTTRRVTRFRSLKCAVRTVHKGCDSLIPLCSAPRCAHTAPSWTQL